MIVGGLAAGGGGAAGVFAAGGAVGVFAAGGGVEGGRAARPSFLCPGDEC